MDRSSGLWVDLALRLGGTALLGCTALIGHALFAGGAHAARAIDYALATIGFLGASAGSAMVWQGRHLFDEIALSARWTSHGIGRAGAPAPTRRPLNSRAKRSAASS